MRDSCVWMCVCVSGNVVSSDKRQAGSTSLREEGKPQQWGTGGREAGQTAVGGGCSAGRFMSGKADSSGRSRFVQVSWPHHVRVQISDNATGHVATCANLCKSTLSLNLSSSYWHSHWIGILLFGVLRLLHVCIFLFNSTVSKDQAAGRGHTHRRSCTMPRGWLVHHHLYLRCC